MSDSPTPIRGGTAGTVEIRCLMCGKAQVRFRSQVHSERMFCGRACQGAWRSRQTDAKAAHWKGGTRTDRGRVQLLLPWHHLADAKGYVYRYQIVAELKLRRNLLPEEVVHHVDEDITNDHPDNLRVFANQAEHARFHGRQRSPEAMANMRAGRNVA